LTATECNSGYRTENGDYRAIFNPHGSAGHQGEWDKRPSNVRISAEVVAGRAASLISLGADDTLSDTLCRDHSRFFGDGIAVPMPGSNTRRRSANATERAGSGLKNRKSVALDSRRNAFYRKVENLAPPRRFTACTTTSLGLA
jgi:hypothetical protein